MSNPSLVRGSQLRCQLLTGLPREQVAARLTELARPSGALVTPVDQWLPSGPGIPLEARIDSDPGFVPPEVQEALLSWWLVVRRQANTPNWDIAATCQFGDKPGLILVEAKAHDRELKDAGKRAPTTANGRKNHERVALAIEEANGGLNRILPDWGLSRDRCYQISNRIAWAWKLASLKVPVVLVYLGFLNAHEMADQGQPFATAHEWELCLRRHSRDMVPGDAWGERLQVGQTPLWLLFQAMELDPAAQ